MLLVTAAGLIGLAIERRDGTLHVGWPPLYATWEPHVGPGTPAALLVAVLVVVYGPPLAARLPWRALLGAVWGTALAWTFSLALVDGWQRGLARRLTTRYEYLNAVDRFSDIPATLRDFTHHILIDSPAHWPPHVAGHPRPRRSPSSCSTGSGWVAAPGRACGASSSGRRRRSRSW